MSVFADGKAVGAVVSLAPPAIEDAHVQTAVATGLHAAGTGGFERTAWRIEPDIASGDHLAGGMHVVVLDKHQVPLQVAVFAQVNDVLDIALAVIIPRVSFAGENELDWPGLVPRQPHDIVELLKNQRSALVSCEPARETDGQRIRIEQLIESDEIAVSETLTLDEQPTPGELNQFAAQVIAQSPKFFIGYKIRIGHALPEFRRADLFFPVPHRRSRSRRGVRGLHGQLAAPEPANRPFHPAEQMDTVGNMADRYLLDR